MKRRTDGLQELREENNWNRQQRWQNLVESNRWMHAESEGQGKAEELEFEAITFLCKQDVKASLVATPKVDPLVTLATGTTKLAVIFTPAKK